jgi:hypothetical protein
MFPTTHFPPMEYTDPNPQNQTYWQQQGHCVPNAPQTQLPPQLLHHQSQQPSFSHQPNKPSKLKLTATTENYDIDIDSSNYEHETNDAAKEHKKNSWQLIKKRKRENK